MTTLFLTAFFIAADPATVWTAHDVGAKLAATKPDAHKITQDSLGKYAGYSMSVTKREASGIGELHETVTDILIFQSGECTLILGGKLVASKSTAANEMRGTGIEGGQKYHATSGDVVRIPAKTPHQMLLDPGKSVVYAVVKVASK